MKMITLPLGALETNCYVVYDEASKACALVDPGAMPQTILDTLEKNELALQKIFLTHAHFDHTGALRALHEKFPDVPIYVNAQDTDETLNMSHGNLVYTDTFLDGDEISMPPLTFRVLATPGHTQGSSCLICGDTIFSGDTLFEGCAAGPTFRAATARRCWRLSSGWPSFPGDYHVLPGHGGDTTLERERRTNYYMREAMRV